MRFTGIFLCMFLFRLQSLWLVDIDTGHEPVKLSPCQVSDLGLFPAPLVSTMYRQLFIDQYKTVSITVQGFDPVSASATELEHWMPDPVSADPPPRHRGRQWICAYQYKVILKYVQ